MASPTSPLLPSTQPSYNTLPHPPNGAPPSPSLDIPNPHTLTLPQLLAHFAVPSPPSAPSTARLLVALLRALTHFRAMEARVKGKSTRETWEARGRCRDVCTRMEGLLGDVWALWVGEGDGPVERVLWESVAPGAYSRVMDFLPLVSVPASFGSHELIQLSLHTTWATGLQPHFERDGAVAGLGVARLLLWLDSFSTPRLLHLHALCLRVAHLLLAIWLSLYPSAPPHWGAPELLWLLFTACTSLELPFHPSLFRLLSLLALLAALPGPPQPSSPAFLLLLASIAVSLVSFHLPLHPSPILLFVSKAVLATSTRFEYLLARVLVPSVLYCLPFLLLSLLALALSLNGDPWHPYALPTVRTLLAHADVAPYETRVACLVAFILAAAGYIWLISFATVELAARGEQRGTEDAQRGFCKASVDFTYLPGSGSDPGSGSGRTGYRLPAPLNICELVLADLPFAALCALPGAGAGRREAARAWRSRAKAAVWRVCVAPAAAVLSVAYVWEGAVRWVGRRGE